jgi:hypothetical protein
LFSSEISSLLQQVDGVDVVEQIVLHEANPETKEIGPPLTEIVPPADGLLCSFQHTLEVLRGRAGGRR